MAVTKDITVKDAPSDGRTIRPMRAFKKSDFLELL
jgi:hypothetical protein